VLSHLQSSATGRTRRDAHEKPLLCRQAPRINYRIVVADRDDLVQDLPVKHRWNKAGADSLNLMITGLAPGDNRRCGRFHGTDANIFYPVFQDFPDAGNRAAGSDTGYESIDSFELLQ